VQDVFHLHHGLCHKGALTSDWPEGSLFRRTDPCREHEVSRSSRALKVDISQAWAHLGGDTSRLPQRTEARRGLSLTFSVLSPLPQQKANYRHVKKHPNGQAEEDRQEEVESCTHSYHRATREPPSRHSGTHTAIASFGEEMCFFPSLGFQTPNHPQPQGADKILQERVSRNSSKLVQTHLNSSELVQTRPNSVRGVVRASETLPSITASDPLVPTLVCQQLPPPWDVFSPLLLLFLLEDPSCLPPLQPLGCGDSPVLVLFSLTLLWDSKGPQPGRQERK